MTTTLFDSEVSSDCTCEDYCYGDCWDLAVDQFYIDLEDWFVPGTYQIDNFPVWYGKLSGHFEAKHIDQFLDCITPDRTSWTLQYSAPDKEKPFEAILYHHDAPTGGAISVFLIPEIDEDLNY